MRDASLPQTCPAWMLAPSQRDELKDAVCPRRMQAQGEQHLASILMAETEAAARAAVEPIQGLHQVGWPSSQEHECSQMHHKKTSRISNSQCLWGLRRYDKPAMAIFKVSVGGACVRFSVVSAALCCHSAKLLLEGSKFAGAGY